MLRYLVEARLRGLTFVVRYVTPPLASWRETTVQNWAALLPGTGINAADDVA
jgi:hypothetical protein